MSIWCQLLKFLETETAQHFVPCDTKKPPDHNHTPAVLLNWPFLFSLLVAADDVTTAVDIYSFGMCALEVPVIHYSLTWALFQSIVLMCVLLCCRWHSWRSRVMESRPTFLRRPLTMPYSHWRTRCRGWDTVSRVHRCSWVSLMIIAH